VGAAARRIATLYGEELRATTRGQFVWLGAGVVLLGVGGVATVGTQDTWLDVYGVIAYFLVPLAFIPLAAIAMVAPRANRFVESLFTAPVERRDWFIAKVLVLLTLAAAYYAALVPMMVVYVAHVGVPLLLTKLLLWAPGLLVASLAVGTLVGVLFIGQNIAAPAATGMGLLLVYAGFVPLQELLVARGNGATRTGHLMLVSPAVLLKNALGFTLAAATVPATTTDTWISVFVVVVGTLVLAVWVFLRAQGVETWEATRRQRWIIALAGAALFLLPAVAADVNYDAAAPSRTGAPAIRGLFARFGSSLALTLPHAQPSARCCSTILNRDDTPLPTDASSRRDLLLLLPVDATARITGLDVEVTGESGLRATIDPGHPGWLDALETRTYARDLGPTAADGHHVTDGWIVRVPVTLVPTRPWDIGGDRYPVRVAATYHVEGEARARTFSARAAIDAQVGDAIYQMGVVSLLLPLVCFASALRRWRATR
jgi:ABC-type transport system involved in multi-copper enzyme maturation permease subunit